MARDHARIRLDIWDDDDWCDLTSNAQWLYKFLLTSPTLTFAGIADWRPARIAAKTRDLKAADVEVFAAELEAGEFVVIDRDSEEVLVRSFVKHDGLLRSPNMAKALVKAFSLIASRSLRGVVVHELKRLEVAQPDLSGWNVKEVEKTLERPSLSVPEAVAELPPNPSLRGSGNPFERGSVRGSENDAQLLNSLTPLLPNSLPSSSVGTKPSPGNPETGDG